MGYDLIWLEDDIDNAEKDYSHQLSQDLKEALNKKQNQIKWKNNPSELAQRFHNTFKLGDLNIAEIWFESQSGVFRAICPVMHQHRIVFYHTTVPKKGSHQERILKLMKENSSELRAYFQRRIDQLSS